MLKLAKLDFTHSDGDGLVLVRIIDKKGEMHILPGLTKAQALDAMAELAEAIRDEFGPFGGIKA